jgi:LysR family transcriptional regulator, glycine cleavage system transcriptional activator
VPRQLPPLTSLRAFEAAARVQSFTAAARLLRISQGAVSHHVAQLEGFLGQALFHRDGRRVRLTAEGAEYASAITEALDRVEQATIRFRQGPRPRALRIRLFPSVAIKWLISRVAEFHSLHPDLELRIATTPNQVRLDPSEDDFTIQIGNLSQAGVHYDPLIAIELLPVCAPAYLERFGAVESAADILQRVLLSSVQRPDDWHLWLHAAGLTRYVLPAGLIFGNSALAYQAAIDGMGVAIAQKELVRDDLDSGRLVPMHPLSVSNAQTYFLASWEAALVTPDRAAFRRWILSKRSLGARRVTPGEPARIAPALD